MNRSTLTTVGLLASIFLFSWLSPFGLASLDRRLYDWCLTSDHDGRYFETAMFRGLRMVSYSESTGFLDEARRGQLIDDLLQSQAKVAVFYPGAHPELAPREPHPQLLVAPALESGHSSVVRDPDEVCRRAALATRDAQGQWRPTIPLQCMARLIGVEDSDIAFLPGAVRLGYRTVSTDSEYRIGVRFRRSEEQVTSSRAMESQAETGNEYMVPFPLESVLSDDWKKAYQRQFRDHVVLIGNSFKEANTVTTPLGQLADFKVDACVLETLMGDFAIRRLSPAQIGWLALLAVLGSYPLFRRLPVLGIAIAWGAAQFLWLRLVLALFPLGHFLGYSAVFSATTLTAVMVIAQKLRHAKEALRRFGGAGAYEAALKGDHSVLEEVREKTATIVFTNVLHYLKEMERYGSPDEFFERRQAYAQLLSDVFRRHGGVILDYQGDFQMIGFNVELRSDDPDHAVHAVRACYDFLERIPALTSSWWEADPEQLGSAHCGVCTGPVACGHVGSQRHDGGRIAQAAIGDTSNVAARLLGAAMKQERPILLAMTTVEAAQGQLEVEPLEPIPLKGKTAVVPVASPRRRP